jgi:hypothetical protein
VFISPIGGVVGGVIGIASADSAEYAVTPVSFDDAIEVEWAGSSIVGTSGGRSEEDDGELKLCIWPAWRNGAAGIGGGRGVTAEAERVGEGEESLW